MSDNQPTIQGRSVGKGNYGPEPIIENRDRAWMVEAACIDHRLPSEAWDTPEPDEDGNAVPHNQDARKVCRWECPVRLECLEFALNKGIEYGIWGGFEPSARESKPVTLLRILRGA